MVCRGHRAQISWDAQKYETPGPALAETGAYDYYQAFYQYALDALLSDERLDVVTTLALAAQGMGERPIAKIVGCSRPTVARRISKARTAIRRSFERGYLRIVPALD